MEQLNNLPSTSVGRLLSRLSRPTGTRECFRLPFSEDDAVRVLLAAVKAEVELRCRTFRESDELLRQLRQLAKWLTGSRPQFGLLLCGGCGNGKTTFVKAFQRVINQLDMRVDEGPERYSMRIVNARDLAVLCRDDYGAWCNLCSMRMLAIDDLGTEPVEMTAYGNLLYPVTDLLAKRYDKRLFTVITTNLRPDEIRPRYGDRIADRLNEMVGSVAFRNSTYRTL